MKTVARALIILGMIAGLMSCGMESVPTRTLPSRTAEMTPSSVPSVSTGKAFLAESNDWYLLEVRPRHIVTGTWAGIARIRNDSDKSGAFITITYLDESGKVTHVFDGAITDVKKGKTVTVDLTCGNGIGEPSGVPSMDIQAF